MSECKHGLKQGCSYCHARTAPVVQQAGQRKKPRTSRLSDKMNDRVTSLNKRLRELRGQ